MIGLSDSAIISPSQGNASAIFVKGWKPKMANDTVSNVSISDVIRIGDVVRLKSGGPDMTVEYTNVGISEPDMVGCVWYDGAEMKTRSFKSPVLEPSRKSPMTSSYRADPAGYLRGNEAKSIPVPSGQDQRWHGSSIRRVQSGANYVAGEVIQLQCGDGDDPIVVRVTAAVIGGAITDIVLQSPGSYKERRGILRQAGSTGIGSEATFEVQGWYRD